MIFIKTKLNLQVPNNWSSVHNDQMRIKVDPMSQEYQSAIQLFNKTINGQCKQILKLERIQNQRWYFQYHIDREFLRKRLGKNTEEYLFHGCSEKSIDGIIHSYFNRSFAGAHGMRNSISSNSINRCVFKVFRMAKERISLEIHRTVIDTQLQMLETNDLCS